MLPEPTTERVFLADERTEHLLTRQRADRLYLLADIAVGERPYRCGSTRFDKEFRAIVRILIRNASFPLSLIEKNLPLVSKLEELAGLGLVKNESVDGAQKGYVKGELFDVTYVDYDASSQTLLGALKNTAGKVRDVFSPDYRRS